MIPTTLNHLSPPPLSSAPHRTVHTVPGAHRPTWALHCSCLSLGRSSMSETAETSARSVTAGIHVEQTRKQAAVQRCALFGRIRLRSDTPATPADEPAGIKMGLLAASYGCDPGRVNYFCCRDSPRSCTRVIQRGVGWGGGV